jgi:hypothetical protein
MMDRVGISQITPHAGKSIFPQVKLKGEPTYEGRKTKKTFVGKGAALR